MARTEIEGMAELSRKISSLARDMDPKIVGQALRSAMKPMLNSARANAPTGKRQTHRVGKGGRLVGRGFLKRNIKLKKLRRRDKSRTAYGLWSQGEAWYGQLLEKGYRVGARSKKVKAASRSAGALSSSALDNLGDRRTTVPGRPWLGPAYARHANSTVDAFGREMIKRFNKRLKK